MYISNVDFMKSQTGFTSQRIAIPLYYADSINHCQSCGHTHWHIGRSSAQCAFCDDAIPLAQPTFPAMLGLLPMDEAMVAA